MNFEIFNSVEDYINDQLNRRAHEFINWGEFIARIPYDRTLEGSYVGSYSVTLRNRSKTFVASHHDCAARPVSASTIARNILTTGLLLCVRKRFYWNRKSWRLLDIPQPLFCTPIAEARGLIYVDISGCYFNIYRKLPIDLWFQGLRIMGGEVWFKDFLPSDLQQYKLCRNSIVGVIRSLEASRIRSGKIEPEQNRNPLLNPMLWGFMAHLLHLFACAAVVNGAIYYNTDGAIFQNDEDAISWMSLINEWGLAPKLDAKGDGWVASIGNYRVGTKRGGRVNTKLLPFNNLITTKKNVVERWIQWM